MEPGSTTTFSSLDSLDRRRQGIFPKLGLLLIGALVLLSPAWTAEAQSPPSIDSFYEIENRASSVTYRLTWSGGGTPDTYQAQYDLGTGFESGCLTPGTQCDFALPHNTYVSVRVRARYSGVWTAWSGVESVTTSSPPTLSMSVYPYYSPGYNVGLAATWGSVTDAVEYKVTHYRQNNCGSASVTTTTTGTSSGSGLHYNCGAPSSCYFKQVTVEAKDSDGDLIASAQKSLCEVGYP